MLKQLWTQIISGIGQLKTPERKLLIGLMLATIITLWLGTKDNNLNQVNRIHFLEQEITNLQSEKETQRILYQDKIDQCADEKYKNLKEMVEQSEAIKNSIKNIKK